MTGPVSVSTSTARVSEMKMSSSLCLIEDLIAIAVPSMCVFAWLVLYTVKPCILRGSSSEIP